MSQLKTPENAKNCLAVAPRDRPEPGESRLGGSGPTSDGGGAEVYAPGVGIISSSTGTCATTSSPNEHGLPASTGLGALVRQYFADASTERTSGAGGCRRRTGALVKAVLINARWT